MIREQPWWPWLKRGVTVAFFAGVLFLLVRYARGVDWGEVKDSMRALPSHVLWEAAALCACSHLLYSCFDLVGRRYTGHRLPVPQVMQVNFISYAFNLNMGSLVGGVAFRYRVYSRLGLATATITRVLTLSMLTNWLGYLLLAGLVFTAVPLELPPDWKLDSEGLRLLGLAFVAVALTYLVVCASARDGMWSVRGHEVPLPKPRMVAVQFGLSCANWMCMAAAVHTLLRGQVPYTDVLSVLLIAAGAGLIVRVPAGLGVLEGVFVAMLAHRVPETQLLGALLAYRALYYIAPLIAAAVMYLQVELRARKQHPVPQRP